MIGPNFNTFHARWLLALAKIYDDGSDIAAVRICGVGLHTMREWVIRFSASGFVGYWTARRLAPVSGGPMQRRALVDIVEQGPIRQSAGSTLAADRFGLVVP